MKLRARASDFAMVEFLKQIVAGQFEAALCMLKNCIEHCPAEHWEGKIGNATFRQVAYHTLFFVDFYLSPSKDAFELRDLHERGGDERQPTVSAGLSQDDALAYLRICRRKLADTLARETTQSLQGDCGFSRPFSRGELHLYNIRHVQHHTGQLSAYLRRLGPPFNDAKLLPWVGSGWR